MILGISHPCIANLFFIVACRRWWWLAESAMIYFTKRGQKRRMNTYLMQMDVELSSYQSECQLSRTLSMHGTFNLYFRFLSYHFCPISRAKMAVITYQQKTCKFTFIDITAKIVLLAPSSKKLAKNVAASGITPILRHPEAFADFSCAIFILKRNTHTWSAQRPGGKRK